MHEELTRAAGGKNVWLVGGGDLVGQFADQGLLWAEPRGGPRPDGALLLTPGDPARSLLYLRVASAEPGVRMPPILRNRIDETYVALLERWIVSLVP